MDILTMIEQARDAVSVHRVFGDPIERDGTTIVTAAAVQGGGGGGSGDGSPGNTGFGGGWGARARPLGAYVIRGSEVTWMPALDLNRVILGGQLVTVLALLTLRTWLHRRR